MDPWLQERPDVLATLRREQANGTAPTDTEPAASLDVISARALCDLPDPPDSDRLIGDLLVRGARTVIGAGTGEGKTTFALALAARVAHGGDFLGFRCAGGGRVLVIDAEQGVRSQKRSLRDAGLHDSDAVDYLRVPDGLSLDRDDRQARHVEEVIEGGGYSLVIADPLYKLHTGDSNAEREAVDLMRRFDTWRERHHFALILPLHTRKPPVGAKFTIHELFGSGAYLRGAEVVVGLQRARNGFAHLHFFKDRDGDLPVGSAWGLLFNRETGFRRDPDDDAPTAVEQIRELLDGDPTGVGLTQAQLADATGKTERTVRAALKRLDAANVHGLNNEKLWRLPAATQEDPA